MAEWRRIAILLLFVLGTGTASAEATAELPADDPQTVFEHARQHAWDGEYITALELYARLVTAFPDDPDYLLGQGQTYFWSGQAEQALPPLQRARGLAPEYEAVWRAEYQARVAADALDDGFLDEARERFPDSEWPEAGRARRAWEVQGAARYDYLNRGADDWRELRADWLTHRPGGVTWSGHARQAWRFDQTDQELGIAASRHLLSPWTGRLDVTASSADAFLPDLALGGSLGRPLASGFGLELGLRHSRYPDVQVNTGRVTLDRYMGDWRAAYSTFLTRLQGSGSAVSHAVSLTHFYHDRSFAGLTLGAGVEDSYDAGSGNIQRLTVRSAVFSGRHWFAPDWAISWDAGYHNIRDVYERWGATLGLRYSY